MSLVIYLVHNCIDDKFAKFFHEGVGFNCGVCKTFFSLKSTVRPFAKAK